MAGFGESKRNKKVKSSKRQAGRPQKPDALSEAIIAYQRGNIQVAKLLAEEAIKARPEHSYGLGFLATVEKSLGNKERAQILFEKSISISQNHPDILHNYSGLMQQDDIEKALELSNRATKLSPSNSSFLERNGCLKWKAGDLHGALESSNKAIEINPLLIDAHLNIGGIYKDLGNLDQALSATLKSLDLEPDNPDALINLGGIYKDLGNLEKALVCTVKSLQLEPDNPDGLVNLGGIYKELGNLDQALATTLKSLELEPDNTDALINLGGIYKNLGNLDQALTTTLKSLELEPDNHDALINLGGIYKNLGNLDQALATTLKSLELKPDNPDALINLGGIHKDLGNLDQALVTTLKSLELKPDNPDALVNLGGIYKKLGNLDQALATTLKCLELEPDNHDALMNLGGIHKELGNLDQALAPTLKSLELKSDNPDALINLSGIYKDLGNLYKALDSILKSLELKPNNPDALVNLGGIYLDLGELDKALASTLKSLELKTSNPDAYSNLGGIYTWLKNTKKASESYSKAYELKPSIENECQSKLTFPWNFTCQEEIEKLRSTYIRNAEEIFKDRNEEEKRFLYLSLFTLSYQNGNDDKNFLEEVGQIVRPYLQIQPELKRPGEANKLNAQKDQKQSAQPRVGFYFDNTDIEHSAHRHYFNFVKNCHLNGIEVVIIKGPIAAKQNSKELEKQSSLTIQLHSNLEQSVRTLRDLNLNMLIYTEIFSSDVPYCLAHNRIAPIQAVLPGNLITTGLSTIDYFITSELMETKESHNLYTEKLIKLKGMPHGITTIPKVNKDRQRSYFGLPEKSQVLGLLHNLIKFHPDWDHVLEEIAKENSNSIFILTGANSHPSICLKERWSKIAPTFLSKSKFFRLLSQDDYFNLLSCADVVLDPLHMGCGTTSIDALSLGIPIVTKPEQEPRTRIVYGLYKTLGIENAPIAYTDVDYVAHCNKLLNNRNNYNILRNLIHENYHKVLTSNRESISQMTEEIKKLVNI